MADHLSVLINTIHIPMLMNWNPNLVLPYYNNIGLLGPNCQYLVIQYKFRLYNTTLYSLLASIGLIESSWHVRGNLLMMVEGCEDWPLYNLRTLIYTVKYTKHLFILHTLLYTLC